MIHHAKNGNSYIVSVHIGTSSAKGMLCTVGGIIEAQARAPYACYYPKIDWVEQDADEVLAAVVEVIGRLVKHADLATSSVEAIVFGAHLPVCSPLRGIRKNERGCRGNRRRRRPRGGHGHAGASWASRPCIRHTVRLKATTGMPMAAVARKKRT